MKGGKRKGAGRPFGSKIENPRAVIRQIRWTADEWRRVEALAMAEGLRPSEFIRQKVLNRNLPK